ncbi:MAG: EAL domain-containing protein, partial [Sphingopyxis sp.]
DYLKIDSGFTRTIDGSDRDRIVVRAIVDLARALGLLVVAEGIENEAQLVRLGELGVATWQGFLKSGPVPWDQLLALME